MINISFQKSFRHLLTITFGKLPNLPYDRCDKHYENRYNLSIPTFASQINRAQKSVKQSSINFVAVVNNNHDETLYYNQNNWKDLRVEALRKSYIDSHQLMKLNHVEARSSALF